LKPFAPMFRYLLLLLALAGFGFAQGSEPRVGSFAGCYHVSSSDQSIQLIPKQIELTNIPRVGALGVRNVPNDAESNEAFWVWEPKGADKIWISWGTGLGGFRGLLKKASNGDLVGKVKEHCDYRCEPKARTVTVQLHQMPCGTD